MPLLTLQLIRFHHSTYKGAFLEAVTSNPNSELVLASEPRYFVIRPSCIDVDVLIPADSIIPREWHLLLLLNGSNQVLPTSLKKNFIAEEYVLRIGVPSKILSTYADLNAKLRGDAPNVRLTGCLERARERMLKDSAKNLELSPDLLEYMDILTREYGDKPVTMLNLLSFRDGGKQQYYQYGQAFFKVAGPRGGDAKIVGNVIKPPGKDGKPWWDEISLVHYPSIKAFCDMLAGDDYQEINAKHRLAVR